MLKRIVQLRGTAELGNNPCGFVSLINSFNVTLGNLIHCSCRNIYFCSLKSSFSLYKSINEKFRKREKGQRQEPRKESGPSRPKMSPSALQMVIRNSIMLNCQGVTVEERGFEKSKHTTTCRHNG